MILPQKVDVSKLICSVAQMKRISKISITKSMQTEYAISNRKTKQASTVGNPPAGIQVAAKHTALCSVSPLNPSQVRAAAGVASRFLLQMDCYITDKRFIFVQGLRRQLLATRSPVSAVEAVALCCSQLTPQNLARNWLWEKKPYHPAGTTSVRQNQCISFSERLIPVHSKWWSQECLDYSE